MAATSSRSGVTTLRSDARRNRDRVLDAARQLFSERGIDVPMATVARHAGVGVATLYRRFPTREHLVDQVFVEQFDLCTASVDDAVDDPDPWRGFCTAVSQICAVQAVDRGFSAAFLGSLPRSADGAELGPEQERLLTSLTGLVHRAQQAGALRPDVTADDLALVVMANDGVVAATPGDAVRASRRLVAVLLSGFRAHGDEPLPGPAGPSLRSLVSAAPAARAPRRPSSR